MDKLTTKYKTNKKVRYKIDKILESMQRIYANHNTNSKYDLGDQKSNEIAKLRDQIYEIDPIYFKQIYPYNELN